VKVKIWVLTTTFIAVFTLFAGAALAQQGGAVPDPGAPSRGRQFPAEPPQAKPNDPNAASNLQQKAKSEAASPNTTSDCTYTFTSGVNSSYLQFCVTVNGNITEFESPLNVEQIRQGAFGEGYGICDTSTNVEYYDYADYGDSGNWDAPVTVTHGATMVKIERTTSDGLWTLTQTITSTPGTNPYAKVLMALKNNSGETKSVSLVRWADVDPGNSVDSDTDYDENFDATLDSVWGYVPIGTGSNPAYGLMFQRVGNAVPASVSVFAEGLGETAAAYPCNPLGAYGSPITNTDGTTLYYWSFDLTKQQSVSVTGRYIAF
jgi:hypothetical protein